MDAAEPTAVDDSSNGSTVQAVPGQAIEVTLHSTYWRVDDHRAAVSAR